MANMSSNKNGFLSKLFNFRSWRLQSKLLVPILLVVVLALGVTWATISVIVTNAITSEVTKSFVELTTSATNELKQNIKLQRDDFILQSEKNVAVNAIVETVKWDKAKKDQEYRKSLNFDTYKSTAASTNFYLSRSWLEQMKQVKGMREIMLTDINGMTLLATNELSDPNNASDAWFLEAVKNWNENRIACTIRGPEYDESTDDFAIYLTSPIRRAGEETVYGWVSARYPASIVFESLAQYNARNLAVKSDRSINWMTKDFTLIGIQETYRVGTNIGTNSKTGKREISYHVNELKDWELKPDGSVIVKKTGKEYKTEKSTLVEQVERYKNFYNQYQSSLSKLDPKSNTFQKDSIDLLISLRDKSFEFGISSQGISRAYAVEFLDLDEDKELGDLGIVYIRQSRNQFMAPVIDIGYILFILIIVLLIVTSMVLILISRSLVNPILILRGSLVEVSLGNYDITVPVTTQDEVGDLANTFNQMLRDIKGYIVSDEERELKSREVNDLIETLSKIATGDLSVRADVPPDEIGALADSVNYLVEQLEDKVQSEEAKEQQDKQIANLLTTVSEMSTGDMTQSAEVTADVLGAVADSVNYMGEQIRKILREVTRVTENISETSTNILKASDVMSKDATEQQSIITDTSAAVDEMAISINQVSQSAESAAQAAENSAKIAEVGGRTVLEAVDAMNRIRGSVAEISKRIKKLGESSQEIGEIVNVISDIAAQTNMLALNAAIEAARAGEQGRGFSVVADAVRQLAERSTKSTKDITLLIRGIQSETSEAIKTMEDSTQEVVEGSKLAEAAQDRLSEIVSNSKQLADLISSISLSSRQQSRATEEVNKSMGMISSITNSSTQSILNAARAVYEMDTLVEELGKAIKRFKI